MKMTVEEITKVPALTKFGYATGHVMNDMCAAMWFTYTLLFFEKVLGIDKDSAGTIMLIGQIIDGLATVFVGICVDKANNFWLCNRIGKRKAWHLMGTGFVLISFPFIFMEIVGSKNPSLIVQMIYYSIFVILFQFGWAAVQISHLSIIPDLTSHESQRTSLTSKRYSATVMSTIAVYCLLWGLIGNDQQNINQNDAPKFKTIALISICVGGLCTLLFHLLVKGGNRSNDSQRHVHFDESTSLIDNDGETILNDTGLESEEHLEQNQENHQKMSLKDWLCEPTTYQVACVYMTARLFVNTTQTYIPLYIQETLGLRALNIALIPIIMYISGFVVSLLVKPITMRIGNKFMFVIACVIGLCSCLLMNPDWKDDLKVTGDTIYVIGALVGFGGSAMLITSLAITAEFVGTNVESSAFIYGAMSFTDKLSTGTLIKILQDTKPGQDNKEDVAAFNTTILTWVCGGVCLAGIISILTLFPKEIDHRRKYAKLGHSEKSRLIPENQTNEHYGAV